MKTTKTLVMTFVNELGKEESIRIDAPRADLTGVEIKTAMETIIAKDIFYVSLVSAKSAQIVTRTVEDQNIAA